MRENRTSESVEWASGNGRSYSVMANSEPDIEFVVRFPKEFSLVASRIEESDLIAHCFSNSPEFDAYDPTGYLKGVRIDGYRYMVFVDTNVLIHMLQAAKGISNPQTRTAVSLIAFCQSLDIDIDPELALHEINNYDNSKADQTVDLLERFQRLNSSDTGELYDFVLEKSTKIKLTSLPSDVDNSKLHHAFSTYKRLLEWDSFYLLALAIVSADINNGKKVKRLSVFLEWMTHNFRRSMPLLAYSCIYFGLHPSAGMMKFNVKSSPEDKRKQVGNMAWDLFMANHIVQEWTEKKDNIQYMFASFDRGFLDILRLCVKLGFAGELSPLKIHLSPLAYEIVCKHYNTELDEGCRNYYTTASPSRYRAAKIRDLEHELGISL